MARAGTSDAVYFLLHIPKTAGQTIQHHLADHCPPGAVWTPPPPARRKPRSPSGERAPEVPDLQNVRAVAGHHVRRSLEQRFAGREIRRIVLLREPLDLRLSLYNYRMMNHLNKGWGTYGFALHLRALPRDFMAHWLLARWLEIPWRQLAAMTGPEKYRLLHDTLAGFWFVADYRACDRLIAALAGDLGLPPRAQRRNTAQEWRNRVSWDPLTEAALSPRLRDMARRCNPLDCVLWQTWRDAAFATAAVSPPRQIELPGRQVFLIHEALRPLFRSASNARKLAPAWLRSASGARSGLYRADQARDAGQFELAAQLYRQVLAEERDRPAVWAQYGHMLLVLGDAEAARQAYREALRLAPEDAQLRGQIDLALQRLAGTGLRAEASL